MKDQNPSRPLGSGSTLCCRCCCLVRRTERARLHLPSWSISLSFLHLNSRVIIWKRSKGHKCGAQINQGSKMAAVDPPPFEMSSIFSIAERGDHWVTFVPGTWCCPRCPRLSHVWPSAVIVDVFIQRMWHHPNFFLLAVGPNCQNTPEVVLKRHVSSSRWQAGILLLGIRFKYHWIAVTEFGFGDQVGILNETEEAETLLSASSHRCQRRARPCAPNSNCIMLFSPFRRRLPSEGHRRSRASDFSCYAKPPHLPPLYFYFSSALFLFIGSSLVWNQYTAATAWYSGGTHFPPGGQDLVHTDKLKKRFINKIIIK